MSYVTYESPAEETHEGDQGKTEAYGATDRRKGHTKAAQGAQSTRQPTQRAETSRKPVKRSSSINPGGTRGPHAAKRAPTQAQRQYKIPANANAPKTATREMEILEHNAAFPKKPD